MANPISFTRAHTPAAITFTSVLITGAAHTVTVGGRVYKFVAAPATAGDVDIAANVTGCIQNLVNAINGGGEPGSDYHADTVPHPLVSASSTDQSVALQARFPGAHFQGLPLAVAGTQLSLGTDVVGLGTGTNAVVGVGDLDDWFTVLENNIQVSSEVITFMHPYLQARE